MRRAASQHSRKFRKESPTQYDGENDEKSPTLQSESGKRWFTNGYNNIHDVKTLV